MIQIFPEVYKRLLSDGVHSQLTVVGSGSMLSRIEGYLLQPNFSDIKNSIEFHNEVNDAAKFYLTSDILIIPSRSEGFPNVLLEAWSYGIPVIASSNSVIGTDLNRSSLSVYDIDDPADFAQKMIDMALYPTLQNSIISNSQDELNQFDSSFVLPQWLQLLDSFLHQKRNYGI